MACMWILLLYACSDYLRNESVVGADSPANDVPGIGNSRDCPRLQYVSDGAA